MAVAACALEGPAAQTPEQPAEAPRPEAQTTDPQRATCDAPEPTPPMWTPVPPPVFGIPVPGFPDAVVAEPSTLDSERPVVVVLHGLGGRPEPHCEAWRNITRGAAFVLCPRGADDPQRSTRSDRRYTLEGGERLRHHVDAALRALSDWFQARVDVARPVLAGFSLGASEAALLAQSEPASFPRVALLEGGVDQWLPKNITDFGARGGQRVLFGCGSTWCTPSAKAASARIERWGLDTRVVHAEVGHTSAPALQAAVREQLAWLISGDARWSGAVAPDASELKEAVRDPL